MNRRRAIAMRGSALITAAMLAAACGPKPSEPAPGETPPPAGAQVPGQQQAERAAAVVEAYFAGAELQAETDAQRAELRRALADLLAQSGADLRGMRYAGPDGTPAQRDLAQLLRGHFVPASPQPLDLDTLIAAKPSPRLVALVRGQLGVLAAVPAASASR